MHPRRRALARHVGHSSVSRGVGPRIFQPRVGAAEAKGRREFPGMALIICAAYMVPSPCPGQDKRRANGSGGTSPRGAPDDANQRARAMAVSSCWQRSATSGGRTATKMHVHINAAASLAGPPKSRAVSANRYRKQGRITRHRSRSTSGGWAKMVTALFGLSAYCHCFLERNLKTNQLTYSYCNLHKIKQTLREQACKLK